MINNPNNSSSTGGGSRRLFPYIMLAVVACLVASPLFVLLFGSFNKELLPSDYSFKTLGFQHFVAVYGDPNTYSLLWNTLVYVAGSMSLGLAIAISLAYLVEKTDMPGKIIVYAGVPSILAVPGMLQAMAWAILFSPRMGMVNNFWNKTLGFQHHLFDVYTMHGMILVEGFRMVPTSFLMLIPLMRGMDPALEAAASVAGARPMAVARRVTLPLLAPGLAALAIYQLMTALEVFEVPGILGLPGGIHVLSTKLYALVKMPIDLPDYGKASALAMVYLLIAAFVMYFYSKMIKKSEKYAVITGKGYRPRMHRLGRWRYPAMIFSLIYLGLAAVLPFLVFLLVSFMKYLQVPSLEAFRTMTLLNYRDAFHYPAFGSMLKNTIIMVLVTATSTVILSFLVSYAVTRMRFKWSGLLDQLSFVPHTIPGIVSGLAWFWVFLYIGFNPLFGTIWSMAIAFSVQFMAYGTRTMNSAFMQIHKELEEAAFVSGARPRRVLWKVFVPLMMPSLTGLWIWTVLISVRAASLPLMLYEGNKNQVIAIFLWRLWDQGHIPRVSAIGTILMVFLFTVALIARYLGFSRQSR